jgi:hypothetical protein
MFSCGGHDETAAWRADYARKERQGVEDGGGAAGKFADGLRGEFARGGDLIERSDFGLDLDALLAREGRGKG